MIKKITILASLVAILGIFSVSSAEMVSSGPQSNSYVTKVYVSVGWNLIAGVDLDKIKDESDIKMKDITAIWVFSPAMQKYLELYPKPNEVLIDQPEEDDDYMIAQSMWVYSKKAGNIIYLATEHYPMKDVQRQLYKGWNFLTIVNDMNMLKLKDLQGSCEIQKIANYSGGKWTVLTPESVASGQSVEWSNWKDIVFINSYQDAGYGVILKVKENCKLGFSNGVTTGTPPSLPY